MQKIREALVTDIGSVISLFRQSEAMHSAERPDIFSKASDEDIRNTFQKFFNDSSIINLVLEIEGQVRGYLRYRVSIFPNISFLTKRGLARCYIEELVVDKEMRRQGFAKQLINEIERRMREQNVAFIHLHVFDFNEGAKALYQCLGFKPVAVEMGKDLN